jgi:hypothetical protein
MLLAQDQIAHEALLFSGAHHDPKTVVAFSKSIKRTLLAQSTGKEADEIEDAENEVPRSQEDFERMMKAHG